MYLVHVVKIQLQFLQTQREASMTGSGRAGALLRVVVQKRKILFANLNAAWHFLSIVNRTLFTVRMGPEGIQLGEAVRDPDENGEADG